jgi:hypothetical protein
MLAALAPSLLDDALLILWTGGESPEVAGGFRPLESRPLPGSERRFLRLYRREPAEEGR